MTVISPGTDQATGNLQLENFIDEFGIQDVHLLAGRPMRLL
jgi:hypothetical protein